MKNNQLYHIEKGTNTVFDKTLEYINNKYNLRFNTISLDYEIKLKEYNDWSVLNLNSLLIELTRASIKITPQKLEILIRSDFIKSYNPIKEYFEKLEDWDGNDYIKELTNYIVTNDDDLFRYHLEKWLSRAVKCALEPNYINKQCLVLFSQVQNLGKTTFLRFLIPKELKNYYTEVVTVDKDGQIAITKNFIINADELAVLSKSDINSLKSLFSATNIKVRLPYARKAETQRRICSFLGSTNKCDFLTDETGSVRWIVFEIKNIDFGYSKVINIDKFWSQVYYNTYKREDFKEEFSQNDILENELRNERYFNISPEQEVIIKHFEKSQNLTDFLTASDIVFAMNHALGTQLNHMKVGKALTKLKYERIKHPKLQVYGYLIKRKI
ncbi:VapE family protein [Riemerella anatipestifer]|uniref:VapE domain-containing protein n=1 Tax=Riemerella anatipestifer TaxID=34085 RepID=UPI001374E91F|nr:VapE domain-containing protein [Riemerella anatipestifer]MDY3521502.1 VapE family protein [Riemerella anatipestifer]MDY3533622.1 VapE family protein [Riemerella anatipestifer]MDY3536027.1 VapE family protein [Riemerella anatipestifer]